MMKYRKPLLTALAASALMLAGQVIAQDTTPQSTPTQDTMPQSATPQDTTPQSTTPQDTTTQGTMPQNTAPMPADQTTATMNTPSGELTVHSSMPTPPPAGPAPSFEQLSGGARYITEDQASAYPLLANDFIYADHNRNGRISKDEYQRWTAQK
jgi:hypothetical protein